MDAGDSMKLTHPEGLWILCGIPVLLLLFFMKGKYRPRTVSNLYLWRLSEKYRRKYVGAGKKLWILLLVLQCLIVTVISLLVCVPTRPDDKTLGGQVLILDTSASMQRRTPDGQTCFDQAKKRLMQDVRSIGAPRQMALLVTGGDDRLIVSMTLSRREIVNAIYAVNCGWSDETPDNAISDAEKMRSLYPKAEVVLYPDAQGISVVCVSEEPIFNISVGSITGERAGREGIFTHTVTSYGKDSVVGLNMYTRDELVEQRSVTCKDGEPTEVVWRTAISGGVTGIRVETTVSDALDADNSSCGFINALQNTSVLLIGRDTYFLKNALQSFPQLKITEIPDPGLIPAQEYDIYIYNSCVPYTLPQKGAVWLINPDENAVVAGATLGGLLPGGAPQKSEDAAIEHTILKDLQLKNVGIEKITKVISQGEMYPALYCGGEPILIAGTAPGTDHFCGILLFDFNKSNLPMTTDFIILLRNLIRCSVSGLIQADSFDVGAPITMKWRKNCNRARMQGPDGMITDLSVENNTATLKMFEPGIYTVLEEAPGEMASYSSFYISIPESERKDKAVAPHSLNMELNFAGEELSPAYSSLEPLFALILLALLFMEKIIYEYLHI